MRRTIGLWIILCLGLLLGVHFAPLASAPTVASLPVEFAPLPIDSLPIPKRLVDPFPRPASLHTAVAFWRQVFGHWRRDQVVLHDHTHLGIVYDVVDLSRDTGSQIPQSEQATVDQRQRQIQRALQDLEHRVPRRMPLSEEQQRLWEVITEGAGPEALAGASRRVREQRGMRESFRRSVVASSQYDGLLRQVFREAGLPEDLAYLPHVESAFATRARSSVGAVGMWQFMPATGRRFLRIDPAVDERYDPVLATRGAARLFAHMYARLEDWGLAITAYNHGFAGMLRAKQLHGPDIGRIIRSYQSPSFGFASRNFYAEFLAIRDLMQELHRYFPDGIGVTPLLAQQRARVPYVPVAMRFPSAY